MSETRSFDLAATLDRIAELIDADRPDLAVAEAAAACARFPREAEPLRLRAVALLRLGRVAAARAALEQALALAPRAFEVLCNLGSALLAEGDADAAANAFGQALAVTPDHPAALNGLGNARRAAGDLDGAAAAYRKATGVVPGYLGAWLNLVAVELEAGRATVSEALARQVLTAAPTLADAQLLLGHALAAQRRHAEAEAAYTAGADLALRDPRFAYQAGLMAEEQRAFARAATHYTRTLALDPGFDRALVELVFVKRQLADWQGLDALASRLRSRLAAGVPGIAPFAFLAEDATAAEQLACAELQSRETEARVAPLRRRLAFAHPLRGVDAPMRVGFVANGFGRHPTTLLVIAAFEALQAGGLDLHLFATNAEDGSEERHRVRRACTAFHDVAGLHAAEIAHRIHTAGIEVLVDLDGYCGGAMPEIFALRPAPIQVNWLAYPGTLGAPCIDYVVADNYVLPPALRPFFSERVAYLPRCFQPSDTTRAIGAPPPRGDCDLPENGVVYVCFNAVFKLTERSFVRMCAVLRAVPDSVLWLLSAGDGADDRLRGTARAQGVDPARLIFMPKLPHAEYLARYRHADLFLDTHPYNAHTTASDALWAGCPVLTCPGTTFAARVAGSLNHHLGIDEMNAADDAMFIETAVRLSRDAEARTALRTRLADRRRDSGVFDMRAWARDFAALLARMAARHRQGLPPVDLDPEDLSS